MEFVVWLFKTLVLLGLFHFVVIPVMHALTRNSWFKLPLAICLAVPSAILMAWLHYVPFLLLVGWLSLNYHSLKVMEESQFEAQARMQINRPLFWLSSYSYIILSCLLGWFLQAEVVDASGRAVSAWRFLLGIA